MSNQALSHPSMGGREWAMLVMLSMLWGASFFFVGIAIRGLPTFTIVFGRVGLATLVILVVLYRQGKWLPTSPRIWFGFISLGLLSNFIPFSLITWGQNEVPVGLASIMLASTPLFAVVMAHFLTKDEPLTLAKVAGVVLGLCGVAILIGPNLLGGIGAQMMGQLAILTAAGFYGLTPIVGRRYRDIPPMIMTAGMLLSTTVMMAPVALWYDFPLAKSPGLASVAALICLALFSTALAYLLYFRILATAGATNTSLVTLLIPVSAVLLGILFLGEQMTLNTLLGMALIMGGLILTDGRVLKWRKEDKN